MWPAVDEMLIVDLAKRRRYRRLVSAMQLYLGDKPLTDVEAAAGISRRRFLRLFNRCLEVAPDGRIWGLRALIAGTRLLALRRRKALTFHSDPRSGFQGAFRKLLTDNPGVEHDLIEELTRRGVGNLQPNRMAFRGVHRCFLKICKEHKIGNAEYPFCTEARGVRPLRRWFDTDFIPRHGQRWIAHEEGLNAAKVYGFQGGDGQSTRLPMPYSVWELDEVTVDVEGIYEVPNATGDWEELELRRAFVIRVLDVATGAKLANRLVLAPQASAEDVAMLLWDAVNGTSINERHADFGLLDGAGYPANLLPELRYAVPNTVCLDNALSHLADHVQHLISHLWGAKVKLGRPGTPLDRPHIESDFSAQARRLLHQLPGTTGSGPGDPVRKNAAVPVHNRIPTDRLSLLIDCYCANANVLPAAASGYVAPIVRLARQLASGALKPAYLPAEKRRPHYFGKSFPVTIKVDLKHGRRPYVNFLYCRYSSDLLQRCVGLKGNRMWVRADFRDIRTLLLFDDTGREFGLIQALGRWGKFPHDVRIRKIFARLKRAGELGPRADDEPLEAIFSYLRKRSIGDKNVALQLAYVLEYLKVHNREQGLAASEEQVAWEECLREAESVELLPSMEVDQPALESAVAPSTKITTPTNASFVSQYVEQPLLNRPLLRRVVRR
jgi:hypothetical protein